MHTSGTSSNKDNHAVDFELTIDWRFQEFRIPSRDYRLPLIFFHQGAVNGKETIKNQIWEL